jgi:hypothetical protein
LSGTGASERRLESKLEIKGDEASVSDVLCVCARVLCVCCFAFVSSLHCTLLPRFLPSAQVGKGHEASVSDVLCVCARVLCVCCFAFVSSLHCTLLPRLLPSAQSVERERVFRTHTHTHTHTHTLLFFSSSPPPPPPSGLLFEKGMSGRPRRGPRRGSGLALWSVVSRLNKAEAVGCSVSSLARCTSP